MGIRDKRKLDYLGFAVLICESRADELNKAAYGEETEAERELRYASRLIQTLMRRPIFQTQRLYEIVKWREHKAWQWQPSFTRGSPLPPFMDKVVDQHIKKALEGRIGDEIAGVGDAPVSLKYGREDAGDDE